MEKEIVYYCPNCGSEAITIYTERCVGQTDAPKFECAECGATGPASTLESNKDLQDAVNHPSHYAGKIECIDYIRDKLTIAGFTDYCIGNVMKYVSRWRKKDGIQDLKKAAVYLNWAIESAAKE